MLVLGVITPVAASIVKPAVELKLSLENGPPDRIVMVGVTGAMFLQKGLPL